MREWLELLARICREIARHCPRVWRTVTNAQPNLQKRFKESMLFVSCKNSFFFLFHFSASFRWTFSQTIKNQKVQKFKQYLYIQLLFQEKNFFFRFLKKPLKLCKKLCLLSCWYMYIVQVSGSYLSSVVIQNCTLGHLNWLNPNKRGIGEKSPTLVQNNFTP